MSCIQPLIPLLNNADLESAQVFLAMISFSEGEKTDMGRLRAIERRLCRMKDKEEASYLLRYLSRVYVMNGFTEPAFECAKTSGSHPIDTELACIRICTYANQDPTEYIQAINKEAMGEKGENRSEILIAEAEAISDHIAYTKNKELTGLLRSALQKIPRAHGRDDIAGPMIRKLALRDEERPTTKDILREAEAILSGIQDRHETLFCEIQFAVAASKLISQEEADKRIGKIASKTRTKDDPMSRAIFHQCYRAYEQSGLHARADAIRQAILERLSESIEYLEGQDGPMDQIIGPAPEELQMMSTELMSWLRTDIESAIFSLILGGLYNPDPNKHKEIITMIEDIRYDPARADLLLKAADTIADKDPTNAARLIEKALLIYPGQVKQVIEPMILDTYITCLGRSSDKRFAEKIADMIRKKKDRSEISLWAISRHASFAEDRSAGIRWFTD